MADVVLSNRNVSRYHAKAEMRTDGKWVLTDMGSSQGSYLYGSRAQSVVIDDHTIVFLGRVPAGEKVELLAHSQPPLLSA
jgi:pSer/pThr/pTyr-binding forkhead associated (FHA) protein